MGNSQFEINASNYMVTYACTC